MKIHRSYYKEYLFFFGTDEQATGEGALGQQVDDLLAANVAVGAMCGFSDEAYTLYFASEFALNNLDYTVEEFVALSQGSFMNVVFPEDRDVVQKALDDSSFEHFEFRMIAKDNTPRWFTGKCTVNVLDDGGNLPLDPGRACVQERDALEAFARHVHPAQYHSWDCGSYGIGLHRRKDQEQLLSHLRCCHAPHGHGRACDGTSW